MNRWDSDPRLDRWILSALAALFAALVVFGGCHHLLDDTCADHPQLCEEGPRDAPR